MKSLRLIDRIPPIRFKLLLCFALIVLACTDPGCSLPLQVDEDEPLRPESAVGDVTGWAREARAADIRGWLQKQPAPAICQAAPPDPASLPDDIRYHVISDPELKEWLLKVFDPVLKLVECASPQGLVLYKGETLSASDLGGGRIAFTPGALYFTGSPPKENAFLPSSELRLFLAREVLRQIVPVEKPRPGLNGADMLLRRELKLDYLAAVTSLTIDHAPTALDGMAADVATYGKPSDAVPGTLGIPLLEQIKDMFGAAEQDFKE